MRSWRRYVSLSALVLAAAAPACFPDPAGDFTDYQDRIKTYDAAGVPTNGTSGTSGTDTSTSSSTGGPIEAGPPPVEVTTGTYLAQCLSELANGQVGKVFSFWATTTYTPNADATTGGSLAIKLEALKLDTSVVGDPPKPPTVIKRADIVSTIDGIAGTVSAPTPSFAASLPAGQTGSFDGTANPISGSKVVIGNAGLKGQYNPDGFCARLTGDVIEPAPAARTLNESKNFCLFSKIEEGGTAPTRVFADYSVAKCPL